MPICFGISFTKIHMNQAGALVHIYQDGSVGVSVAAVEMGQGVNIKMVQVAARRLCRFAGPHQNGNHQHDQGGQHLAHCGQLRRGPQWQSAGKSVPGT